MSTQTAILMYAIFGALFYQYSDAMSDGLGHQTRLIALISFCLCIIFWPLYFIIIAVVHTFDQICDFFSV